MENNSVKVYGYIRVSTEGQVKQGYSLAEQQAEIQKYCKKRVTAWLEFSRTRVSVGQKPTRTK